MTMAFMRGPRRSWSGSPRALSDDVVVVAPETDQSGVAHSLSLNDPLRLRKIASAISPCKGTPTDCVIMGVRQIMADDQPDLVLSGVNRGQNVAEDVTYSGTIAGAMEGAMLGIPSIALSQAYGGPRGAQDVRWDCAETHAPGADRADPRRRASRRACWSTSIFPPARRARSQASRSPRKGGATPSCCASRSGATAAAIPITG